MVYFSKLRYKIQVSIYENMTENFIFWVKKSTLFDQLFEFHELKYRFIYSKNDDKNSENSIKNAVFFWFSYCQKSFIVILIILFAEYSFTFGGSHLGALWDLQ